MSTSSPSKSRWSRVAPVFRRVFRARPSSLSLDSDWVPIENETFPRLRRWPPSPSSNGDPRDRSGTSNIYRARRTPKSRMTSYGSLRVHHPPFPPFDSLENILPRFPAPHDRVSISSSSTSEGIPMDCGTMPSRVHPLGQRPSRRQILSRQAPEQGTTGKGNQTRGWMIPFTDHRTVEYQQDSGRSPHGVYDARPESIARPMISIDSATNDVSPYLSPLNSSSSDRDLHLQSPANPAHATPSPVRPSPLPDNRPFRGHGWVEYLLPDESLYYVHQGYQVVTDMDLDDEQVLDAVMAYLEDYGDVIPPGQELWLRDIGSSAQGGLSFNPLRCFVDHVKRSVSSEPSHEVNGSGTSQHTHRGDKYDRLDAKYRYWSFMEAYPAHTSLPLGAYQEAMDVLGWASTDGLMPAHGSTPAPFTQEECRSLTTLLQSTEERGETPLRAHTVSKILLRVICWRQSHFRPDKPLPVDASHGDPRQEDHSTPARRSGSVLGLTVGVYVCLVTAIALGPSGTFVRIAGIGAILFPLSLLVSGVVALAQSKTEAPSM